MMKTNIAILLFSLIPSGLFGQGVSWVKTMGGEGSESLFKTCTDTTGNLYVCGSFGWGSYTASFGDETLVSIGLWNNFLVKLDSNGDFLWARRMGGMFSDIYGGSALSAGDVLYDPFTNRLYLFSSVIGQFQSVGSCTPRTGGRHLSSFDTDGNCLWTTTHPNCLINLAGADGSGFIYCAFRIEDVYGAFNGELLTEGWYIAKLDAWDGTTVWITRVADSENWMKGRVDKIGNLYLYGHLLVEDGHWDTLQLNNHPRDIFLAKYDGNGAFQWIKTYGGPGIEGTANMDMDDAGNIYMFGSYSDSAHFGSDILLLNDNDDRNLFLAKLDNEGEPEWVSQVPVQGTVFSRDLRMTQEGELLCIATFNGSMELDEGILHSKAHDAVMLRFDSAGNRISSLSFRVGGNSWYSTLVQPVSPDKVYLISGYSGETSIQGVPVTGFGNRDVLVARLNFTTGIMGWRLGNELHIYANPSNGRFNITVPDEFGNEPRLQLRIMDMEGRLVSEQLLEVNSSRIMINLESEAKGVYNISLSNGVKQYFGRAVFE